MLHLKGYTAALCSDDGFAFVEGFGDFYFEAFAGGELKYDVRGGEEGVEELVIGCKAHD